jgi:hypothetical protein
MIKELKIAVKWKELCFPRKKHWAIHVFRPIQASSVALGFFESTTQGNPRITQYAGSTRRAKITDMIFRLYLGKFSAFLRKGFSTNSPG